MLVPSQRQSLPSEIGLAIILLRSYRCMSCYRRQNKFLPYIWWNNTQVPNQEEWS